MKQKSRLALKMLLVVALLGISVFAAGFQIRADTDVGSFSAWRPWTSDCGCHSGAANTWGEGTVEFDLPMVVLPGQHFTIRLRVAGFVDAADLAQACEAEKIVRFQDRQWPHKRGPRSGVQPGPGESHSPVLAG